VTFKEVKCDGLADLQVGWLPSHFFRADPEFAFGDLVDNPFNDRPQLSAGPFVLQSWTPGDNVVLTRNQRYWRGPPHMDRLIFRIVADPAERMALLLAGELDETPLEPDQLPLVAQNPAMQVARFAEDGYDLLALNLADPENPQPGLNANGAVQVQIPHPILGDPTVRAAIAHALDDQAILDTVYLKQAYPLAVNVPPVIPWAHDPGMQSYLYDPILARRTLEEAGWVDTNRDGVREKDIESLALTLLTRAGGRHSEQLAVLIEDQLEAVGFDVTVTPLSSANFAETLLGQRYDMAITGWTGLGADPDDHELWSAAHDRPGEGFNFVSYYNPEVEDLLRRGLETPGCQLPDRAPIYKEVQRHIHEDLPYVFLAGAVRNVAYKSTWGNVRPGPWSFYHNVHEWYTTVQ
jgi:peptide/nickel transport system substrate-binding protein